MANSILCAIDFSESSLHALQWAADLSSRFNAHLTVLYPYRLMQTSKDDVLQLRKRNEEIALTKFGAIENEILNGKNISFDFKPEIGFVADRIEDHIRKNSILMLVIGKNMNAYSQENLEQMVEQLKVPVVVVP